MHAFVVTVRNCPFFVVDSFQGLLHIPCKVAGNMMGLSDVELKQLANMKKI